MTTVSRWVCRQLLLLTPSTYRELPPGDRRGRHRQGQVPGVAFELHPPAVRSGHVAPAPETGPGGDRG